MKRHTKLLSLLFAAVLLLSSFAACADNGNDGSVPAPGESDTSPAATVAPGGEEETTAAERYDKDGHLMDDLPETLDYKQETVTVLYWDDVQRAEFKVDESETGLDPVTDAVYNRNAMVEKRLKIMFEWVGQKGNNNNITAFRDHVQNVHDSGEYYDIVAAYSRTAAALCSAGLLHDISTVEENYIDLEKPWWPASMVETCSIGDSLYFVSGDISTNLLHMMYAVYYNIDMLENLQLENPIPLVDTKKWMLDKLIEMSSDLYKDSDDTNTVSVGDSFGFTAHYYHLDALYTGAGLRLVENTDDPYEPLKISDDYWGATTVDLVDRLIQWFASKDAYGRPNQGGFAYDTPFIEERSLFVLNRVNMADTQYSDGALRYAGFDYGILPVPLYDDSQENYITMLGNPFTLWGIMSGAADPSMATAVLECLASEGYRKTTPAIFETNMKYRYVPNNNDKDDAARMFDIIRENIDFDLGRIFSLDLKYMSEMPSRAATENKSWGAMIAVYKKSIPKAMAELNEALVKMKKFN